MFSSTVHRRIYLVLLTLLGGCMVTSKWAANLMWVLLGANWLLEGRWEEKWRMAKESRLLQAVVAVWGLYAVGLVWTSHLDEGLRLVRELLPLAVVPLVVLTTPPPTGRARLTILWLYAGTVAVVSVIGLVRMLTIEGLPYRETIPYVSHIRFALHCCLVAVICLTESGQGRWRYGAWLLALWMAVFVMLMRSYTAVAVLTVVSLVLAIRSAHRGRWVTVWVAVAAVAIGVVVHEVMSYYRMVPLATEPLREYTVGGRPYTHRQDGLVENGNYLNNYLCLEELRAEWARRGGVALDEPEEAGYTTEAVLIRYLNALGLTKDSVGVASLTEEQMDEVGRGVENPVYEHGWPVRRMVYVMLFEYENHRHYRVVAGFTMLQRMELWRAAWRVFMRNLWIGTGTGDLRDELKAELAAMDSPLQERDMRPHNQYLSWLAMFGVAGGVLLLWLFCRALKGLRGQPALIVAWALTVAISCLTENTLDTVAGMLLAGWFMAFRR